MLALVLHIDNPNLHLICTCLLRLEDHNILPFPFSFVGSLDKLVDFGKRPSGKMRLSRAVSHMSWRFAVAQDHYLYVVSSTKV